MARKIRKEKKKFVEKKETAKQIFKTINGRRQKYVSVNVFLKGKRVNKQYKYRGGKFRTYIDEAKLPQGARYYINYTKDQIIRNPDEIDALIKKVRDRKKLKRAKKKGKAKKKRITKKEIFKELRIIPKRTYKAPEPVEAERIVKLLDGKIYYEREHSVTELATKQQQDNLLLNIISKGTKSKAEARKLLANFDKIKLKISYAVVIEAYNVDTKQIDQIATFTAIGKKPSEIVKWLTDNELYPSEEIVDIGSSGLNVSQKMKEINGYPNKVNGSYRITDVRMVVKFYNNPQMQLSR